MASAPASLKQALSRLLHLFLLIAFLPLSVLWLALKLQVSQWLSDAPLSVLDYLDIIRAQSGLDFGLCLLFLALFRYNKTLGTALFASTFFMLITFYFLKLTGLYVYTYDATPWGMIEYGSYMLALPFAGRTLSILGYLVLPFALLLYLYYSIHRQYREIHGHAYPLLSLASILLILLAFIPPQQNKVASSIAYHPYIYSISGVFSQSQNRNIDKPEILSAINSGEIKNEQNIVFVILESFSRNALRKDITPVLHALQRTSLNFEQARADIPHTSKALISIHCGEKPFLSPYLFESVYSTPQGCLTHHAGKPSAFFQSVTKHFENREALVEQLGFNDFFPLESFDTKGFQAVNYFSYEDDLVLETSHQWISEQQQTFIATYLTGTSHHNYQTPDNFNKKTFDADKTYNRYLNSVAYVDRFVGKLIQQYKSAGLYEKTVFVIVGDHGEGFNRRQSLMHNNNIYESGLHVPLMIHDGAGKLETGNVNTPIMQSGILGLLTQLLDGASLAQWQQQQKKTLVFSSCWYMDYCYAVFHQEGETLYKLIADKRNQRNLLYELGKDPNESTNLFEQYPALASTLLTQLDAAIASNHSHYHRHFNSIDSNYQSNKAASFSPFQAVDY